jgi:hypothetical protein
MRDTQSQQVQQIQQIQRVQQVQTQPSKRTRSERFLASRYWVVLRNILGWILILAAFVAGPLVPGPGGLPLFLIGFALISFPGKRRLTARVLRGKPVRFPPRLFAFICGAVSLALPALLLTVVKNRPPWAAQLRAGAVARGPVVVVSLYLISAVVIWGLTRLTPHALNLVLRMMAKARRKFRPWLRRHRIRLLPPRWRRRRAHETGSGPLRLKDEILKWVKRRQHQE